MQMMAKLRFLRAEAFRGARFSLPLDFTNDHRSIAIFGENATGKSTITDALEWFIHDRVDHLWREGCKQAALRHFLAKDEDVSLVEVHFDAKGREGSKSLSAELRTTKNYSDEGFETFISGLKDERIILRHVDIINFLDHTKSGKREAIAQMIGYEDFTKFRSVIQQVKNSLQKDVVYTGAWQQSQNLQAEMVEKTGQVVAHRAAFLEQAKEIVAPFGLKTIIADEESYNTVLDELRGLGISGDKIRAVEQLDQLENACYDLKDYINQFIEDARVFTEDYNALAMERENVNKLRLNDFLTKGKVVIDDEDFSDDQCPFCLNPYELNKLRAEVGKRLSQMAELQSKLETTKTLKGSLLASINSTSLKAKALADGYNDLKNFSALITAAKKSTHRFSEYSKTVEAAFEAIVIFKTPEGFDTALNDLRDKCEASSTKAKEAARKLDLTDREKQVAEALTKLQILSDQVKSFEQCQRTIDTYESQILTLSSIFDQFVVIQNSALQTVLDAISEDVGAFYAKLHPNESVDKVRLCMVEKEGVEFEYSFHGQLTQPPRKYLSESHLNSLGIVLFLANARIFNKNAKFLVLDDIVTSFDTHHRRRLLRLIRDEFSDWQFIVLTHENIWFDLIKREMSQKGWLFKEVYADETNGISLDYSPATLKEIIEKKKGKEGVTNDLRKLLEAVLKDICFAFEIKVPFRFNAINEKRMSDELLSHLRSTLKKKSPDLAKDNVFSDLAGSSLIANLDSHDNPDKIVDADIDVLLEDIEKLAGLFFCSDCNSPIRADVIIPGSKSISCKCGKTHIPWSS